MPASRPRDRQNGKNRFQPVDSTARSDPQHTTKNTKSRGSKLEPGKVDEAPSKSEKVPSVKQGRPSTDQFNKADSPGEDIIITTSHVTCLWVTHAGEAANATSSSEQASRCCGTLVASRDFAIHVKHGHRADVGERKGHGKRLVRCRWRDCKANVQYDNMARHVEDVHLDLRKRCCLWCGHLQRFHEYHGRHGSARSCAQRTAVLDSLFKAPDTATFTGILDVLEGRGGDLEHIFEFLLAHGDDIAAPVPSLDPPAAGPSGSASEGLPADVSSCSSSEVSTPVDVQTASAPSPWDLPFTCPSSHPAEVPDFAAIFDGYMDLGDFVLDRDVEASFLPGAGF
ncbi:hypothetical protein OH77DRAFT_1522039 [Trametes cingulata]|nr:hypothetical protein OH77DRAFT_1522039 [Trametes cingulata]